MGLLERTILGVVLIAALTACGDIGQLSPRNADVSSDRAGKSGSKGDLLYVSGVCGGICIYTYPKISYVASITGIESAFLCADSSGDVYATESGPSSQSHIYEFAHGETTPIKTLKDTGFPEGCSVDPTTGNLAVANYFSPGTQFGYGDLAIYTNAQGTPSYYKARNISWYYFCAYDGSGNLLVDGNGPNFAMLAKGGNSLKPVTFSQSVTGGAILWDGQYFDVGEGYIGHGTIDRVSISGSSGTVVSQVTLTGKIKWVPGSMPFVLAGNTVSLFYRPPGRNTSYLGYWHFPQGGNPKKIVKHPGHGKLLGDSDYAVAISRKSQ